MSDIKQRARARFDEKELFDSYKGKLWSTAIQKAFTAPFPEVAVMYLCKRIYDLAIAEDRKRVVEMIQETNFWKACNDYFTPEQREFFINLITNKK